MGRRTTLLLLIVLAGVLLLGYALANDGETATLQAQSVGQPYAPMVTGTFTVEDGNDSAPTPAGLKLSFINGRGLHDITICATTTTTAGGIFAVTIPATPNCGGSTTFFVAVYDGMNVGGAYVTPQNVTTPAIAGLSMPAIVPLPPTNTLLVAARYFGDYFIEGGATAGPAGQQIGLYPGALSQQAATCASGPPARCIDPSALAGATVCGSGVTVDGGRFEFDLTSDDPACVGTDMGQYLTILFARTDTGELIGKESPPVSFDLELLGIPHQENLISFGEAPSSPATLSGGVTATATATDNNPPQSAGASATPDNGGNSPLTAGASATPDNGGPGPGNTPPGGGPTQPLQPQPQPTGQSNPGPAPQPPSTHSPTCNQPKPEAPATNQLPCHVTVFGKDPTFDAQVANCFTLYYAVPGLKDLLTTLNNPPLSPGLGVNIRQIDGNITNIDTHDLSGNKPPDGSMRNVAPNPNATYAASGWLNGPGASSDIFIPATVRLQDSDDFANDTQSDPFSSALTAFDPQDPNGFCVFLIHELAHAADNLNGTSDPRENPKYPGYSMAEANASRWENIFRMSRPPYTLRTTYTGFPLPPEDIRPMSP